MRALVVSLVLLASVANADRVLRCDDYYPRPDAPTATILVGNATAESLHCFEVVGDLTHGTACPTTNGVCCVCNVSRGFAPECGLVVRDTDSSIDTECTRKFPPAYFGGSTDGAFVTIIETTHRKHKHRKHRRKE